MSDLKYRDATADDLPGIVAIYNSTVASRMVTADSEPVSVESRRAWFFAHEPRRRPLWIVEDADGSTVGWVSFQDFYGRAAYDATAEISIYLAPDRRGRGLGCEILRYAIETVPALGVKTLLGYIFAHNEPSLRLFRGCGFEDWATLPRIAVLDGAEKSLKILGRRIG
ncbi:MAG: N-acetyltransferase [Acidobacteria bacterium]|nr:N-acetyltransferase [Acidobacteriota bacterium]